MISWGDLPCEFFLVLWVAAGSWYRGGISAINQVAIVTSNDNLIVFSSSHEWAVGYLNILSPY